MDDTPLFPDLPDYLEGWPVSYIVESFEVSSGTEATEGVEITLLPSEWADRLGFPGFAVTEVKLDHSGRLTLVMEEPDPRIPRARPHP